ncbi:MAG: hypothetical protein HWE30_04535 [Methylocystaceae bacterium]|nr:hypothetical protein [Methylocystaceae bacterium]
MTFAADLILSSNVPFIKQGHPLIAKYVDEICEELACRKPLNEILAKIDQLMEDIEPYLLCKSECQAKHNCEPHIYPHDILQRLIDLRNTLSSFGDSMPPSVAVLETRQWAQLHIFSDDIHCQHCAKVLPKQ